jgi:hypothetical protein
MRSTSPYAARMRSFVAGIIEAIAFIARPNRQSSPAEVYPGCRSGDSAHGYDSDTRFMEAAPCPNPDGIKIILEQLVLAVRLPRHL